MNKIWVSLLVVIGGCVTAPVMHLPQLSVPMAEGAARPGTVYIRQDAKDAYDGNSYELILHNPTNSPDPVYLADTVSNPLPRRVHLDLSIDGGSNWIRRIAYGAQTDEPNYLRYVWSPPRSYAYMTTHARIRATKLDGSPLGRRGVMPWDLPPGVDCMCYEFTIAGIVVEYPAGGEILYNGVSYPLRWRQTGGEGITRICWMTPDTVGQTTNHVMGVCSNTVSGTNTFNVVLTCPPSPQAKIVILCDSDPALIGYSNIFEVD